MGYKDIKGISREYFPLSGKIALSKGFITEEQLKEALTEQIEDDLSNRPHRFLGQILYEKGWISHKQVNIILNELFKTKHTPPR